MRLDAYTLQEAVEQNKKWQEEAGLYIPVSVNVYLHPGWKDQLGSMIVGVLDSVGLEAKYLELEIAENRVYYNLDAALPQLETLKVMLDDFGTELSSFNQLKRPDGGPICLP